MNLKHKKANKMQYLQQIHNNKQKLKWNKIKANVQ